jgi:hypothetical protein
VFGNCAISVKICRQNKGLALVKCFLFVSRNCATAEMVGIYQPRNNTATNKKNFTEIAMHLQTLPERTA